MFFYKDQVALGSPYLDAMHVVDSPCEVYDDVYVGAHGDFIPAPPAYFPSHAESEGNGLLYHPFFAPGQQDTLELPQTHAGVVNTVPSRVGATHLHVAPQGPPQNHVCLYAAPLVYTHTPTDTERFTPIDPALLESEATSENHPSGAQQTTVSSPAPETPSDTSSVSTTPEPPTPPELSGFKAPQLFDSKTGFPFPFVPTAPALPMPVAVEQERVSHSPKIQIPTLPYFLRSRNSPATPGSSGSSLVIRSSPRLIRAAEACQLRKLPAGPRFPCTFIGCCTTFQDPRARDRHIRSIHNGRRSFCPKLCRAKGYSRDDALNRHLNNLGEENECKIEARKLGWHPNVRGSVRNLWVISPGGAA